MIFDAHAHFLLAGDPDKATAAAPPVPGLHVLACGVETADMEKTIRLWGGERPGGIAAGARVRPFIGIHPWFPMDDLSVRMDKLERLVAANPWVGVGEIGLDRHRTDNPFPLQEDCFRKQLEIAAAYKRPANIHCVRAFGALIEGLRDFSSSGIPFLVHAYSGSKETVREIVDLGGYLSFAPFTIQRKSGQERPERAVEALRAVPADRLLLDTDFPERKGQGMAEYPAVLERLYADTAEILGTDREKLKERVFGNGTIFTA